MKNKEQYCITLQELQKLNKKIECLEACFQVISEPKMLDAVNYQLLGLQCQRKVLFSQLKTLHSQN